MKRCLKFMGLVATSAAVSAAVTYVMTRVHDVRGFEVPGSEGCACGGVGGSGSFRSKCGAPAQKSKDIGSFLNRDESALAELRKNYCAFGCVSGCPALEDAGFGKTCALAFGEYCPGPGLNGTRDTSCFDSADAEEWGGDTEDEFGDFDFEDEFEDSEESYGADEVGAEADGEESEEEDEVEPESDSYEPDEVGAEPEAGEVNLESDSYEPDEVGEEPEGEEVEPDSEDDDESYEDEELGVDPDDADGEEPYEDDELDVEPEGSDEDDESEKESDDVEDEVTSFCPYGEIGCLSPMDFDGALKTCPCANIGNCLRQHTVVKPDSDAFGGSYGGHGLHAETVAFEGKDVSGDDGEAEG